MAQCTNKCGGNARTVGIKRKNRVRTARCVKKAYGIQNVPDAARILPERSKKHEPSLMATPIERLLDALGVERWPAHVGRIEPRRDNKSHPITLHCAKACAKTRARHDGAPHALPHYYHM